MNNKDILNLAKQINGDWWIDDLDLIEFAKLVAAKEREDCAKVCDDIDKSHWGCEVKASWCSKAIREKS